MLGIDCRLITRWRAVALTALPRVTASNYREVTREHAAASSFQVSTAFSVVTL